MTIVVVVASLAVLSVVVASYERSVSFLKTELNFARTNEQLLLSRLQARSLGEFSHGTEMKKKEYVEDSVTARTYLFDPTGLVVSEKEDVDQWN